LIEKSTAIVHNHLDFIKFLFENPDKQPNGIDLMLNLIAVYDREGTVVKANERFRKITGITENAVENKKINIFECMNTENKGLAEAAKTALYNGTKYFEEVENPLYVKTNPFSCEIKSYTKAAFFPITHNRDRSVEYGAAVFLKADEPSAEDEEPADD